MDVTLFLITSIISIQMTFAELQSVAVKSDETTFLEGDEFTALCSLEKPISSCAWDVLKPNEFLNLEPNDNLPEGIEYYGRGLKYGDCGIKIISVTKKHNREFVCRLELIKPNTTLTETLEPYRYGKIQVVIAKAPIVLHINVTELDPVNDEYSEHVFEENKRIRVECKIEFIRPEANFSWSIGDEPIEDELDPLDVEEVDGELTTVRQTLTRNLTYLDNGKNLTCVVLHKPLGGRNLNKTFELNVYFPSKLKKIEQSAITIGQLGEIVITTYANPKPNIEWQIDGEIIQEGATDATGRFQAANLTVRNQTTWEAVLHIDDVRPEDAKKNYTFTATNIAGEIEIRVLISVCHKSFPNFTTCLPNFAPTCSAEATTCPSQFPDPKTCPIPSVDVTAWSITVIVTSILLIISVIFLCPRLLTQRGSYKVQCGLEEAVEMTELRCKYTDVKEE